jgi:secreted trypsin-like serine protease
MRFRNSLYTVTSVLNVIPSLCTVFQCDKSATCGCSHIDAVTNARIVGGEMAVAHSWGWTVSIDLQDYGSICGGTILSERYIVTGAHCIDGYESLLTIFSVAVGRDRVDTGGSIHPIKQIHVHEDFDEETRENDIAILELSKPINFSDANVVKICIPLLSTAQQVAISTCCRATCRRWLRIDVFRWFYISRSSTGDHQ